MKFKENAIKPGMVIHCPKEEDARVLLEHLTEMGYEVSDAIKTNAYRTYKEKVCFYINPTENVSYGDIDFYAHDEDFRENEGNLIITEFSDLIEPDEPQMSAVKVLEWLDAVKRHPDAMEEAFGVGTFGSIFDCNTPRRIIEKITAYEAARKAPKPVEVEWDDICRIIQIESNGGKKCVHEEDITGRAELVDMTVGDLVESILKKYISEHEGKYFAVIENACRVKEDK